MRVLIAAGGTAGHVVPALAVAAELSERGAEVTFAGTPDRIEARMVTAAGYPFLSYRVRGIPRRPSLGVITALAVDTVAPAGVPSDPPAGEAGGGVRGRWVRVRPDAGGLQAGARVPAGLLEVDAHMGVANRMASPLVRRVFLAFPIEGLRAPHHLVTGRPVPRAVLDATREQGRTELGLSDDRKVVLVIGGSLGALSLNTAAADAWSESDPGFTVLNIAGSRSFAMIARRATPLSRVIEFARNHWHRSWPQRIWACRAQGPPCSGSRPLRAPQSAGAVAQRYRRSPDPNAAYLADGGAAVVVRDGDLTAERLASEVSALLEAPRPRLEGMGAAGRGGCSRSHRRPALGDGPVTNPRWSICI